MLPEPYELLEREFQAEREQHLVARPRMGVGGAEDRLHPLPEVRQPHASIIGHGSAGVLQDTSIIDEQEHSKVEEKYQRVIVEESKTDDLYLMIEKNILKLITQKLDLSKEYFDLLSSLRRLEKIADRSVSIASLLQFAKLGGDIVQS